MKKIFPDTQSGTSLVELMIAAGLLGFIGVGASQFFQRMGASEYEAKAKASAISETNLYLNTMERDFKLRDISAASTSAPICPSGKCKAFAIDRKVKAGSSDVNMKVSYSNVCANIPASMVARFKNFDPKNIDFKKAADAKDLAGQGACFRLGATACGNNQYPQFVITLNAPGGATLPSYPRLNGRVARFPDLNDKTSAASNVIGAVVCAESKMGAGSIGSDRITIETAYLAAEGRFRVEKRDLSIPRSNVAKIQMLPSGP